MPGQRAGPVDQTSFLRPKAAPRRGSGPVTVSSHHARHVRWTACLHSSACCIAKAPASGNLSSRLHYIVRSDCILDCGRCSRHRSRSSNSKSAKASRRNHICHQLSGDLLGDKAMHTCVDKTNRSFMAAPSLRRPVVPVRHISVDFFDRHYN
jgi:hypothetical protein